MDQILNVDGQCDGYRYVLRNEADPIQSVDISFTGYCAQSLTYQQNDSDRDRVRQHERMPVYDCYGGIQGIINRQLGYVELEMRHESHPSADAVERLRYQQLERNFVPSMHQTFIDTLSGNFQIPTFHLCKFIIGWTRTFERKYRLHPDQLLSGRILAHRYNQSRVL
ncbi:hypothetical protein INT45_011229 [Circinella minor]|uniref:Uncharacterized protein n=1 Tax=Circinella minor TaxID=1195481 RepID=A0A8H7VH41_9FUNG|nr:hypothetical protein INT45_011229 [Circinella minor]